MTIQTLSHKSHSFKALALTGAAAFSLSACAMRSQNNFGAGEVGGVSLVAFGTVVAERQVDVTGRNSGTGAAIGVGAGALAGSTVGHGGGSLAGLLAGAVIGGIAGAAAEQAMADRKGIEYTITLENKNTIAVVQNIAKDDQPIATWQRVMVQINGNYTRVLPADAMPARIQKPEGITVTP